MEFLHVFMADWDFQCCLDQPSTTHITEAYSLKADKFDPDTLNYPETLSREKF